MLIIASVASIYNLINNRKKESLFGFSFLPFLIYFLSIITAFIIDLYHNKFDVEF
jgi:hypothetical protein